MAETRKQFMEADLRQLLERIGNALPHRVHVYLLGGGAMVFRKQKGATKDLDLVFSSAKDCQVFCNALGKLGFAQRIKLERAYAEMNADGGVWDDADNFRLDLFVGCVCNAIRLSDRMISRADTLGVSGNLDIAMVSNEDVILFKGITERDADLEDIASIVASGNVDWSIVLDECKMQSDERPWYGALLDKLNDLRERHGIDAPITGEVEKLYETALIKGSFKIKLKKGASKSEATAALKKEGFTDAELRRANVV